jgi:hypothetical protein
MPHASVHAPDPAGDDEHFELLVIGVGQGGIPLASSFARVAYTALRDAVFSHSTLAESLNILFAAMDRAE